MTDNMQYLTLVDRIKDFFTVPKGIYDLPAWDFLDYASDNTHPIADRCQYCGRKAGTYAVCEGCGAML